METHDPSLCDLDTWLLSLCSGVSAMIAGTVFLIFG
jgi:hypothetical protein